ncbi:formyltransferase family protein [Aeromonas jandaei]
MSILDGVVLLCAQTARSAAYVQALIHKGLRPQCVILYGERANIPSSPRDILVRTLPWFCPDLSVQVEDSLKAADWPFFTVEERTLDSEALLSCLGLLSPSLIVYSGYGGQLVPDVVLNMARVLHIHSGMLPRYRGSTTLYHEILEHNGCAASAILLTTTIDTGPLIACREYPMPPSGMDVDYLYDNLIRADLLTVVLAHYQATGLLPSLQLQKELMPAYFVIHPVLKHLALKKVDCHRGIS